LLYENESAPEGHFLIKKDIRKGGEKGRHFVWDCRK